MGKTEEDIAGKEKSLKENALRKNMSSLNSGIKSSDALKASNTVKNSDTVKNSNTSNTLKGKAFEDRAVAFLEEKGYKILERNSRFHHLEMDLVAKDGETLCFIEVKGRKEHSYLSGIYAVDRRKQRRLRTWATAYLCKQGYSLTETACRFDVVSIEGEKIQLIQNAF
jgi:TIGR00252 family protein